eukprot:IDg21120t1
MKLLHNSLSLPGRKLNCALAVMASKAPSGYAFEGGREGAPTARRVATETGQTADRRIIKNLSTVLYCGEDEQF